MIGPELQAVAQTVIGHALNSLPEGLLIALFAGMMLRFLPRQNSGTRFAVWFVALLSVAGLPVIDAVAARHSFSAAGVVRPVIDVPLISMSGRWGLLLFAAWVLAGSIAMLRLALGLWRLRGLRRSCREVDEADLDSAALKALIGFKTSRAVKLATSETVRIPAVLGFFKPIIVIPTWALRELPPEKLRVILLHEFAHLRRWDDWSNLLQKVVRALFILHPAVWWIENRLSLEREMACDDAVVAETANPRGYAECMIALLEKSFGRRGLAMAQAVVDRAREASLRLAQILDARRPNTKHVWKPALGLVGAFSIICLMIVPRAPKLVAFDQSSAAIHTEFAQSAWLGQSEFPSAAVIPAAMHTSASLPLEKMPRPLLAKAVEHRHPAARVVQLKAQTLKATAGRSPVHFVTASVEETVARESDALLLIRTMQRVGPDSCVWSVSVWRVILVTPVQDGTERAPIAHKT